MKRLPRVMRLKLAACAVLAAFSIAALTVPDQRTAAQTYLDCGTACQPLLNGGWGCVEGAQFHQVKCGHPGMMESCWTVDCWIG
jgi:hypothetical protein